MAEMDGRVEKMASQTIDLLEARMRKIEYALMGTVGEGTTSEKGETAAQRLAALERSLHQLASRSKVAQDLLRLHARHPELFHSTNPSDIPTTLDTSSLLAIVLASASSYPSTASRLISILDVPVPSAETSAQLVELLPRIAKVQAQQTSQSSEIAELRDRSAAVIQKWYSSGVLRAGQDWANLEDSVEQIEQKIRREALSRRLDNEMV